MKLSERFALNEHLLSVKITILDLDENMDDGEV